MQLQHLIPAVFAAGALAAPAPAAAAAAAPTFNGFSDATCQKYDGTFVTVTSAQLQEIAVQRYASSPTLGYASLTFTTPAQRKTCPINSDDTYKWVDVPQWQEGSKFRPGGGAISVVYYKETNTYNLCRHLANAQMNGYRGICK